MADYIERKKVLKFVNDWKRDDITQYCVDYVAGWNDALEQIESNVSEDIPAADVRPERYGKWKGYTTSAFRGFDKFGDPIYRDVNVWRCSKCNRQSVVKEKFCPNCGAKMDGKESK